MTLNVILCAMGVALLIVTGHVLAKQFARLVLRIADRLNENPKE